MTTVSANWGKLGKDEKSHYNKLSDEDRRRYDAEKKEIKSRIAESVPKRVEGK